MERVILHYDMDCFYASIETRDNPKKYKNKPMVVAGGVVTTANYEARKYGIHSAMSTYEAKNLCQNLLWSVPCQVLNSIIDIHIFSVYNIIEVIPWVQTLKTSSNY